MEPGTRMVKPANGAGRGARAVSVPRGCAVPCRSPEGRLGPAARPCGAVRPLPLPAGPRPAWGPIPVPAPPRSPFPLPHIPRSRARRAGLFVPHTADPQRCRAAFPGLGGPGPCSARAESCGKQGKIPSRSVPRRPGRASSGCVRGAPAARGFPGPDLSAAAQGHYITALAALVGFLSSASPFICVFRSSLWGLAFVLPSWTKARSVSLASCRSRDCPGSHASQEKTQFLCSQGETQAAFKRLKPAGQQNVRGSCTGFIRLPAKFEFLPF